MKPSAIVCRIGYQVALLAGLFSRAWAADGIIEIKLPYHLAYDLKPIEVVLGVKGTNEAEATVTYCIYDFYKKELVKKDLVLKPDKGEARQTVSFTPPKYGWYAVQLYVKGQEVGWQKHLGVTPKFPGLRVLKEKEMRGGWNDEAAQAFSGLMLDRTNTRMGHENAERVIADAAKYGVTLLMQFESPELARDLNHIREWVTKYKGRVKYWELVNEPNFPMGPDQYAEIVKAAYPVIKECDPEAVVMGPDVCGMKLDWYEGFYKAGGGKFVDAISIHDYEGNGGIDIFHWNHQLDTLRQIMSNNGDADKPIWQTERAIGAILKSFGGPDQAVRVTAQRDIMEAHGIPNNHNNHYYVQYTGYEGCPSYMFTEDGPFAAPLATRIRYAMTLDRPFVEKLDFGPTGNKVFLGLHYEGKDGTTITLRNHGCLDLPLEVAVTGGSAVEVVDAFGNTQSVPVKGGKATLTITQMPIYVRLTKGQELKAPCWDFGTNMASEAKFVYSGGPTSDAKLITDGVFQNHHTTSSWGPTWEAPYTGKVFNEKPETFDIVFPSPRPIDKLLIFGERADMPYNAILDYDLQYHDGKGWVTLEEVRTPCPPSDPVVSHESKVSIWYLDNNFFVHQFKKPVKTDQLRLVIRRISRGCFIDMIVEKILWKASNEKLELREIEVYGPPEPKKKK